MKIVLAGIIGRYPWGGVTWCSLMYLLGLRALGHEVWYLEDTCECNYDPEENAIATDPKYALRYIHESLAPFGFGSRWCYVDYLGNHHGISKEAWKKVCKSADLMLVLSGGCWSWREHYLGIPRRAFIDSDPGFTQMALAGAAVRSDVDKEKNWYAQFFLSYDVLFTFGANIGKVHCAVPTCGIDWHPTWQPIVMDQWKFDGNSSPPRRNIWTTIMTWRIESFTDIGGNKDLEFLKVLALPDRLRNEGPEFEVAVSGPLEFLRRNNWRALPAFPISADLWRYQAYIQSSRAEFSVAKNTYVRTRGAWFSDRTECYLASGHPAVVQDTGFSDVLPVGAGLFAWGNIEEAIEAIERIESDYNRHCKAAHEMAAEFFASDVVLKPLLEKAMG